MIFVIFVPTSGVKKMSIRNYYRPQRSWGKVMFLQVCVILFKGVGVPDQVHPPRTRYTPPGPGTPPQARYIPQTRYTPWDQVHPQDQVHPPGTPPWSRYTPQTRYTPGTRYTPQTRYTPPDQGDTVYARAVRILLECNLVFHTDT